MSNRRLSLVREPTEAVPLAIDVVETTAHDTTHIAIYLCQLYDILTHVQDVYRPLLRHGNGLWKYLDHRANPTAIDIRANFILLERAVNQFDTRFTLRALRSISSLRKRLTDRVLCSVIILTYSPNNPTARTFIEYIGMEGQDIQSVVAQYKEEVQLNKNNTKEPLPEVDVYIAILIQVSQSWAPDIAVSHCPRYIFTTKRSMKKVRNFRRSSWTRFGS